jgi:hypothetical protein
MKGHLLVPLAALAFAIGTALVYAEQGTQPGGKAPSGAQTPDAPPAAGDKKGKPKESGEGKQGTQPKGTEPKQGAQPKATEPKQDPKQGAQPKATEPKTEPKAKDIQPKAADPKQKNGAPPATGDKAAPKADKGGKGTTTITTEQRTEIRQTIIKSGSAPRVTNVDFTISVGTVVPRTVKVAVLPPRVIEIYPAWRGYRYFLVGDRIIIIDDAYRIVFIIET